jgi:hypothetical protein
MSDPLLDWPRSYYKKPGGKPFLFYVVFGDFSDLPALAREQYRSEGVFPGLDLQQYSRGEHAAVLDGFRQGNLWDELKREKPTLAKAVRAANACLILRGDLEDQAELNYLRDSVGLLTFLLDHGGVVVYDPQMLRWWEPVAWKKQVFDHGSAVPLHHVVILTSEEEDTRQTWFHTRGMRKFGRPDLSIHGVSDRHAEGVIELFERFIQFQAFGGIIEEGQEIRRKAVPKGMTCHHAGDLDNPDFNNLHVEISTP